MAETDIKPNRWTKRLLVGSLAVNLLIVGLVVGVLSKGGPGDRSPRFDLTAGPITRAMAPEDRDALRETLRDSGVFRSGDRNAMRADVAMLVDALKANTFDAEAFRAALLRQRTRLQNGQDQVLNAITAQITDMTPKARAEFADRLEQQVRRGSRDSRSGG